MPTFFKTIPEGTYIYHATPLRFEAEDIQKFTWFSTNSEQAITHASYKHFGCPNARLLVYKTKVPIKIVELSLSLYKLDNFRDFGRELFAKSLIEEGQYAGWMIHESQAEFTLCKNDVIQVVSDRLASFDSKVVYTPLRINCDYKWGLIEVKPSRSWWKCCY
jgi:hypothetical protein